MEKNLELIYINIIFVRDVDLSKRGRGGAEVEEKP
jgi:hypothetical protein